MGRQWLQYERRVDIVQTLENCRKETIPNLAAKYGVSERTIAYDIDALTANHLIEPVRGKYGGVRLVQKSYQNTLSYREQEFLLKLLPSLNEQDSQEMRALLKAHGSRRNKERLE